jgi:hypothetical protein
MTRLLVIFAFACVTTLAAVVGAQAGAPEAPSEIALPNGHMPEGIEVAGNTFYAGSRRDGSVYAGDVRTGEGAILVPGVTGRVATGLKYDRGRLWVSGANTGNAYVYDASTGSELAAYTFATAPTFVNDVVVTKNAAWFTDSQKPVLYRVPLGPKGQPGTSFTTVPLTGDYVHQAGFNVNGIDARSDGKTLVIVQSSTGKLFTVTTGGVTDEIELADGATAANGDGILLDDRILWVVQNQLNRVATFKLSASFETGRLLKLTTNPRFDIPTTVAERGPSLFVVNARFSTPPTLDTPYWITRVPK